MTDEDIKVPIPVTSESSSKVLLPDKDPNELVLTFAGNIVKHLGVQMYSGRPIPAIAELISNSWDADARTVSVKLPLDEPWESSHKFHIIEIIDDGDGMTWDMIKNAYLDVGRDRREEDKTDHSREGRPLQGRKGIGKLAGFGIADVVEVQTVYKDEVKEIGEKALIWFKLALSELKKAKRGQSVPVDMIYAGPISKAPQGGRTSKGTTIILRQLHERKAQSSSLFHSSMAQRFLVIGPKFRVVINDEELKPENIELQWKWPEKDTWIEDDVNGCGSVKYWIGFSKTPRKQNEGQMSGILIYTRGKISQEATFFEISGGVYGQHGLRYMVGMIRAEWLDADMDSPDQIATPRDSIAWESPQGVAFREWGQNLVKEYLKKWAKLRSAERETYVKEMRPDIKARIDELPYAYKDVASRFIENFKNIEIELDEFESLLMWFLDALENATLRSLIDKIRTAEITDLNELDDILSKMEVRTAVSLLQIVESNLAAIDALEKMHDEDDQERGVISKHLQKNPWLIHPTWMLNKPEAQVAKWVSDNFGLEPEGTDADRDRADFFCVSVGGTLHIVEIKRGAYVAKEKDILQADKYRTYVTRRFDELTDAEAIKYSRVQSHLVSSELHPEAKTLADTYRANGFVMFTTWSDLIQRAKHAHSQFISVLKEKSSEKEQ